MPKPKPPTASLPSESFFALEGRLRHERMMRILDGMKPPPDAGLFEFVEPMTLFATFVAGVTLGTVVAVLCMGVGQ